MISPLVVSSLRLPQWIHAFASAGLAKSEAKSLQTPPADGSDRQRSSAALLDALQNAQTGDAISALWQNHGPKQFSGQHVAAALGQLSKLNRMSRSNQAEGAADMVDYLAHHLEEHGSDFEAQHHADAVFHLANMKYAAPKALLRSQSHVRSASESLPRLHMPGLY